MRKLSKKLTIVSLVVLPAILGGCFLAPRGQNTNEAVNANNTNQAGNTNQGGQEEIDTSEWKTYRNEEYGFEFRYPGEWGYATKKDTGTVGFGSNFFGLEGEDMVLFSADLLIYPSLDEKYFDEEKNQENISEIMFKNDQGLTFVLLDGIISGQEEGAPLWQWRDYYLKHNNGYLKIACLNKVYSIIENIWLVKNQDDFCNLLVGQIKFIK